MYRITFLLIIAVSFLMTNAGMSQQRTFVVERGGVPCGKVLLHVDHLRNGYVEYSIREEQSFIDIDERKINRIRSLKILADSGLRVVSIDGFDRLGTVKTQIEGSCMRGTLYMSRIGADGQTMRWREDCATLPDLMVPELLRKRSSALPEKLFSLRDMKSASVSLRIDTLSDGIRRITINDVEVYAVYPDGTLQYWEHLDHRLRWKEADGSELGRYCDLDYGIFWDAGQALLPTSEDNINVMDLALSGVAGTGVKLNLTDNRQQSIPDTNLAAGTLHVRVQHRDHYFTECPLPVDNPDLREYLQDAPMLSLDSDMLRERAAVLRDWDRNGANVAKSILRWCGDSFTFDPYIPLLESERLLRDPRGSALHAAQLFVSLARKAAVPARFVLGMHPVNGRWRSTFWVEVWTTEWVSVRPGAGRILREAQYIKLTDAATLEELQNQAARLWGLLRLQVLNVVPADTSEGGALRTGIINRVYSNRNYRCSVTAPEGWIMEERILGKETVVQMVPELGSDVLFEMHLFENPYFKHTLDLYNTRLRTLAGILKEAEIEQEGEMNFSGREVPFVLYSYLESSGDSEEQRMRTADCIVGIGNRGYVFRFSAPEEKWTMYSPHLENILQSVRLLLR